LHRARIFESGRGEGVRPRSIIVSGTDERRIAGIEGIVRRSDVSRRAIVGVVVIIVIRVATITVPVAKGIAAIKAAVEKAATIEIATAVDIHASRSDHDMRAADVGDMHATDMRRANVSAAGVTDVNASSPMTPTMPSSAVPAPAMSAATVTASAFYLGDKRMHCQHAKAAYRCQEQTMRDHV
jgi:hypothetical protein